jgi:flagellar biosynthesis/type III secretory pathway protein FliH
MGSDRHSMYHADEEIRGWRIECERIKAELADLRATFEEKLLADYNEGYSAGKQAGYDEGWIDGFDACHQRPSEGS